MPRLKPRAAGPESKYANRCAMLLPPINTSNQFFQRADMAIGALQVMAEREAVVDFSVPFYDMIGTTILMKLPSVPTSLFKFLSVLDDTVWGCIVAAYFVTR